MDAAGDDEESLRRMSDPAELQRLSSLNKVLLINILLQRLKLPLHVHVDYAQQISVVIDDGAAPAGAQCIIYTGPLEPEQGRIS